MMAIILSLIGDIFAAIAAALGEGDPAAIF
jgi:hypothetical protein